MRTSSDSRDREGGGDSWESTTSECSFLTTPPHAARNAGAGLAILHAVALVSRSPECVGN